MFFVLTFIFAVLANSSPALPTPLLQEKHLTPIGEEELGEVLRNAHTDVFGHPAPRARLAVAWGQIALENGRGKLVYNHNLGNIGPYRGHPYYKHGFSKFRSFDSFPEAARVYWELLRDRCSAAMFSFDQMNALYTAGMLRRCGYHRTEVERYARGLNGLMWAGYRLLG